MFSAVASLQSAGELAQQLPGALVGAVVGGVAALDPELHGHGAVARHGEDVEQLLQVGPVVLVVAVGDGQPEPASQRALAVGRLVVTVKGDGGGVVVQLVQLDAELAHGVGHDGQGERGDVGVEEAIEGAAGAVVVQRGQLPGGQPQQPRVVPRGPLADAVEGLAGDQEVLQQDQQGSGGADAGAAALAREVAAEELVEAEPPEEAVEDRQGGDASGGQGVAGGVRVGAGVARGVAHGFVPRRSWRPRLARPVRRARCGHGCPGREAVKGAWPRKIFTSARLDASRAARDLRSWARP
jgi:hypothetical protein